MEVIFKHVKEINIKDSIFSKFLCMPCLLDMNRKSKAIFKFVWTDFLVPVDVASVVACWCIPVEVYREEKQTGMPSYRLRGCQTNQGAQDGNHICPNYPQPLDRPPAGPLKSSGLLGHEAQPEQAPAGTTYMNQSKTMNQHCQHCFDRWWNWRKLWNYGCCFKSFQVHVWNLWKVK